MRPALWRFMTLAYAVALLVLTIVDAYGAIFDNANPGYESKGIAGDLRHLRVTTVGNPSAITGTLAPGDTLAFADESLANRLRFERERPGDAFVMIRTTPDGRTSRITVTMTRTGPASPRYWTQIAAGLVFLLVGMVIAARRPDDPLVRLLVGLFISIATSALAGAPAYAPLWFIGVVLAVQAFTQVFIAYAALALATSFPRRSERGVRLLLARANLPLLATCVAILAYSITEVLVRLQQPPALSRLVAVVLTVAYYVAVVVSFVLANRGIDNADRKRLQWVAWTLAAGFSGQIILLACLIVMRRIPSEIGWLNLTLLAMPFGLGYAIVRHRVIDVGFVINRALVFGTVSAIVVLCFGALEWLLGGVLVRVSHITSSLLELGLALVLGLSLRGIHGRVDRFVDDLFFRARHEAERALRAFARDVTFISDPRVAVARTHEALLRFSGATDVAIYIADPPAAARVDLGEGPGASTVDLDDPALVRLRATRAPLALREVETALRGDRAFPMCVRDTLTGAIVLGAKTTGETYAPDEVATIETVALALAAALDALHTAALKAELARVLVNGGTLDALRDTADAAAWLRGVRFGAGALAQPAGSLPGLTE